MYLLSVRRLVRSNMNSIATDSLQAVEIEVLESPSTYHKHNTTPT